MQGGGGWDPAGLRSEVREAQTLSQCEEALCLRERQWTRLSGLRRPHTEMPKAWLHLLNAVLKFHFEVVPRESQHALVSDGIDNVTVTELEARPGSWWRQVTRQPPPQGPWSAEQPAQPRGRGPGGAGTLLTACPPSLAASWEVLPIWSGRSQGVGGAHPSSKAKNGTSPVTREAALLSLPDSALPHFAPCPGDNPTGPEKRGVKEGTGVALGVCRGLSVSPAEQGCARWPDLDMGRWQTPRDQRRSRWRRKG